MLDRKIFNVTVLGIHTFAMIEEITETANTFGDECSRVFDGQSWLHTTGLESRICHQQHVLYRSYNGSARATPTGFGMVANEDGDVVAYISPNGRAWLVEYWKCNGVEQKNKRIKFSALGLTPDALSADQREMNRACGYDR